MATGGRHLCGAIAAATDTEKANERNLSGMWEDGLQDLQAREQVPMCGLRGYAVYC